MNLTLKCYSTSTQKLTPKWNRNDHQNRLNYIAMLATHWASRKDTCLKNTYLCWIPRSKCVANSLSRKRNKIEQALYKENTVGPIFKTCFAIRLRSSSSPCP